MKNRNGVLFVAILALFLTSILSSFSQREIQAAGTGSLRCDQWDKINCDIQISSITELNSLEQEIQKYTQSELDGIDSTLKIRRFNVEISEAVDPSLLDQIENIIRTTAIERIEYLFLNSLQFTSDISTNAPFDYQNSMSESVPIMTLYLPKINTIKLGLFSGNESIAKLVIQKEVTSIETNALASLSSLQNITYYGDFRPLIHEFAKAKINALLLTFDSNLYLSERAYFENLNVDKLHLNNSGSSNITINLDQLFGNGSGKATLTTLELSGNLLGIKASQFPNLKTAYHIDGMEEYEVSDASLVSVPKLPSSMTSRFRLNLSNNQIDFTNSSLYKNYHDQFPMDGQKPNFNIALSSIKAKKGDPEPNIPLQVKYVNGEIVDFSKKPSWADATYFNQYLSNVSYKGTVDMNKVGSYTLTYYSPNNVYCGNISLIVVDGSKEIPTIQTSYNNGAIQATLTGTNLTTLADGAKIIFKNGSTNLGEAEIVNGVASLAPTLGDNLYSVTAHYSGNTAYESVISHPITFYKGDISLETPTITLTSNASANPTPSDDITFTANITTTGSNDLNANATVVFKDGTTTLDTVNVVDGKAQLTTKLSEGIHYITAQYSGNTNFESVTSSALTITTTNAASKETPSITLTSNASANPTPSDDITFTANITNTGSNDLNANATAVFKDGTTTLDTVIVTDGKAEFTTKFSEGSHAITAQYSGNTDFESVTSTTLQVSITASRKHTQTISFTDSSQTITYGDTPTSNAIVQSDPHGSGAISYQSSDDTIATIDETGEVTIHKAGQVTFEVLIEEDNDYQSAKGRYTLQINPKTVLLEGVEVEDKTYDGTTSTTLKQGEIRLSGILSKDEEDITIQDGDITFAEAKVGTHIIVFENFALQGSAKDNYIIEYPTLQATIQKALIQVLIMGMDRKEGEANPIFTYTLIGLKNGETEATISGYTKPTIECDATQSSKPGTYAIKGKGASADNYLFTYVEGDLTITAKATEPLKADYRIQAVQGKNGWYTSQVIIKPSGAFTHVWDGKSWVSEYRIVDGIYTKLPLRLKTADDQESEPMVLNLKIDSQKPEVKNIQDGATYYLNRAFECIDSNAYVVRLNGNVITDRKDMVLEGNKTQRNTIEIEDEAGNIATYVVETKAIQDISKNLSTFTKETISKKDEAVVRTILKEMEDLQKDSSYLPNEQQIAELKQQIAYCESLLAAIKANEEKDTSKDEILEKEDEKVATGDENSLMLITLMIMVSGSVFVLFLKKHMQEDNESIE